VNRRIDVREWRRYVVGLGLPILLLATYGYFALSTARFSTVGNAQDVVRQGSPLAILAFGQAFAILSGGIDLSVGSTVGLASVIDTLVTKSYGTVAGALAAVLAGLTVGAVNGLFIAHFRVNPFIVTLGMLSIVKGISLMITGGSYIQGLPAGFSDLGYGVLGPIPLPGVVALGAFAFAFFLLSRTSFGRQVYAVGGNAEAARLSGLHVKRVVWAIYVVSGGLAAVAGIVLASRVSSGQPDLGDGLELQSIAAVVLGGVSLFGGLGSIVGVLFGVLFVSFLQNGLNLQNVPSFTQLTIIGGALIVAVAVDRWLQDRAARA
jgi:ribose transport system permease protein